MDATTRGSRLTKVTLALGFLALLGGTTLAFQSPATGFELSIYAGTPLAYWIGMTVALAVSVAVSFAERESPLLRDCAMVLGAASITSVVALPLVRGYYHFGAGDSLTHLGWTRDIVSGQLDPANMLYPGVHTMTIFVSNVVGTSLSEAQILVTLAFFLVYVAFVTLCIRMLGHAEWAVPVGLFSALLVLPNNNVSVHLMAHPITQSLLFLPVILYLVMQYVGRTGESTNRLVVTTPVGAILAISAVALVLVHPQGALNVVAILLAITAVQFFFRRFRNNGTIQSHRPLYVPTAVATIAFAVWAPRHERVRRTFRGVVDGILSGSIPGDEVAQRTTSLTTLGGSIEELFLKLFAVALLFCVLAGGLAVAWYLGRLDRRYEERNALLAYLVIALVPLTLAFGVFFAASFTTQHFRYVGFIMVPVTILGALAISEGAGSLRRATDSGTVRLGLVVTFLALFALPIATMHASPFIYQPTHDVSAQHVQGAETTFERMDQDVAFAGIRGGPDRLLHATQGTEGSQELDLAGTGRSGYIREDVFDSNLTTHYDGRRYVPVSESDYQREVELYDGFRYSERGFERLDASPAIDRVYANGEYRLYVIRGQSDG